MSLITIDSILIKKNPSMFSEPIVFQVTFTALSSLPKPLQWKVIYVGSAQSEQYDQVLEEFEIGPINDASTMKFQVDCSSPDPTKIPYDQLLSVTAIILTVSYSQQQFIRVGYYAHNQFISEVEIGDKSFPPISILIAATRRTIIADKPRITYFPINWNKTLDKIQPNKGMIQKYPSQQSNIVYQQLNQINQSNYREEINIKEVIHDKLSTESYSNNQKYIKDQK